MVETLNAVFTSNHWIRFFLDVILFLYFLNVRFKSRVEEYRGFLFILLAIIARDILFGYFQHVELFLIGDSVIILLYVWWARKYTGFKKIDVTFWVLNGLAVFYMLIRLYQVSETDIGQFNIYYLMPLINAIFLATVFFSVSRHNTRHADIIINMRRLFSFVLITGYVLLFFFGMESNFVISFILPLLYTVHFLFIFKHQQLWEYRTLKTLTFHERELDSLFEFMEQVGIAITDKMEMDYVLKFVVKSAVQNINADAGAVLMVDEYEDVLVVRAVKGLFPPPYPVGSMVKRKTSSLEDMFRTTPIQPGETVIGEAAEKGEPVYVYDTRKDERTTANTNDDICFISSIVAMPLVVNKKVLGVLAVIRTRQNKYISQNDYNHLKSIADFASLTIDNLITYMELLEKQEMEREVGIAADIQTQLLPAKLPKVKNAELAAFSNPAKGVSGDYYDAIPIKRGRITLVMCDVAGKGVPASLVMVMIRTIIHLIAGAEKNAKTIMTWVNKGIAGKISIDRFATLSFIKYDPATGHMEYANAAHHPLMIYRSETKEIESLDAEGLPIGLEKDTVYTQATTQISKGDILLLYTDGVIEAMNSSGEQYSYERLAELVKKNYHESAAELCSSIKNDIYEFVGNARQHDDTTLMLLKAT